MSRRRKRSRNNLADHKAVLAAAYGAEPELAALLPLDDLYKRDKAVMIVPGLWSGLPPKAVAAVIIRRVATLTGECPCCGSFGDGSPTFLHDNDCPATNEHLTELLRDIRPADLGARLVDPTPTASPFTAAERVLLVVDDAGQATGRVAVLHFELRGGAP